MNFATTMIVCTTLIFVMTTEPAQACTCAAPAGPADGLKRSTVVFSGRVVEISRPVLDRIGLTRTGGHRVKFLVLKQWKGAPSKSIELTTRLTGEACGFPFEEKKEYLVYVVAEPKEIQTGICTGTKNIAEAAQEMIQLDAMILLKLGGQIYTDKQKGEIRGVIPAAMGSCKILWRKAC